MKDVRFATTAIVPYNFSSLESSALTSRSSKKGELAQETLRVRKGTHFIPSENNCHHSEESRLCERRESLTVCPGDEKRTRMDPMKKSCSPA